MPDVRHALVTATLALGLLAGASGCGGDARPAPSPMPAPAPPPPPPLPPPPPVAQQLFKTCIVSGWDRSPVTARLVIDGVPMQTDGAGCVADEDGLAGRAIDIETSGFLPRKTRIDAETLTLWPAANAAEVQAIRQMLFVASDLGPRLAVPDVQPTLVLQLPGADRYLPAFQGAADEINDLLQAERFRVSWTPVSQGQVWNVVADESLAECGSERVFGFCLPYDYLREDGGTVKVSAEALAFPGTPLRMMAYAFMRTHNPLPGLLHPGTQGATTLSQFERQTLRMMHQRKPCTLFPDTDRDLSC